MDCQTAGKNRQIIIQGKFLTGLHVMLKNKKRVDVFCHNACSQYLGITLKE